MSLSRRQFIVRAGLLAGFGPGLLAACGGDDKSSSATEVTSDGSVAARPTGGVVRIAAWPFYIENDQNPKKAATIANFIKKWHRRRLPTRHR